MGQTKPSRRQQFTSWLELERQGPGGVISSAFVLGDQDDATAPRIFRSVYPPDFETGRHTHESDYAEVILDGSMKVGNRWHTVGDIRIVKGGTVYGPLVAGPDGATVLFIFRDERIDPVARPGEVFTITGADGPQDVTGLHLEVGPQGENDPDLAHR